MSTKSTKSTQSTQPQRKLPRDVYDYLELAALAEGGIGGGNYSEDIYLVGDDGEGYEVPMCAIGFAKVLVANNGEAMDDYLEADLVEDALRRAGIIESVNDDAVERINARRGRHPEARVPFKAWAKELGVVRGAK